MCTVERLKQQAGLHKGTGVGIFTPAEFDAFVSLPHEGIRLCKREELPLLEYLPA